MLNTEQHLRIVVYERYSVSLASLEQMLGYGKKPKARTLCSVRLPLFDESLYGLGFGVCIAEFVDSNPPESLLLN